MRKISMLIYLGLFCEFVLTSCDGLEKNQIERPRRIGTVQHLTKREVDFYNYFVNEAPKHPADYSSDYSADSIQWLNVELIKRTAGIFDKNTVGIFTSIMYSGIELFVIKSTTSVLMTTETVFKRSQNYHRILRTIQHTILWYTSGMDIFRKGSPAYKSLQSVRRKHRSASYMITNSSDSPVQFIEKNEIEFGETWRELSDLVEAIRGDLAFVVTSEVPPQLFSWNPSSPLGQFDLGMVQFIKFIHLAMNPRAFGVYLNPEDIQALVHFEAVIGRILGLEDRFNVALNLPPLNYKKFYTDIVVANLKIIDEPTIHIMKVTMEALSENIAPSIFKLKCWLYHSLAINVDGFRGDRILNLMDLEDLYCLTFLGVNSGPLNFNMLYKNLGKSVFNSWFQHELRKFNITVY